jgi:hypothetical protein
MIPIRAELNSGFINRASLFFAAESNDVVRSPGIIASRSSFIGHWSLLKNRPLGSAAAWIWLIKLDPKVELSLMVCKLPL